jgi:hypothetical protein
MLRSESDLTHLFPILALNTFVIFGLFITIQVLATFTIDPKGNVAEDSVNLAHPCYNLKWKFVHRYFNN